MALTNTNLELIKALAQNDIHMAKKAALASLSEDTTKKNAGIINQYRKMLIGSGSTMLSNLPSDLQTVLVGEVPGNFDPERYYIRPDEEKIMQEVLKMKRISEDLSLRRIPYKNTALLYGASGTGKTELGRYIAYRLNLPFFYISFTSAIDSYMGSTAKNIHKIFRFCNSIPCVLMLDEVDCVAVRRNAGGSKGPDGELERTTISLMQELDQLPNHVVLIAATNRLDIVDEALLRRFSIRHEVTEMSKEDLQGVANQFLTATETAAYVDPAAVGQLIEHCTCPGQMMPDLIRMIGSGLYAEHKEEIEKEIEEEETIPLNLWEVTYTWKKMISAETEEDAISIGRQERNRYLNKAVTETYTAKRVDYLA